MKRHILLLSLLLMGLAYGHGQPSAPGYFHQLSRIGGKIAPAFALAQDNDRFIWIGTDDGLVRYDGYHFEIYRHQAADPQSIGNNRINTLLYDRREGKLFVGTDIGAAVYDAAGDNFRRLDVCGNRHVKAFLRTGDSLWIGTTTGLLLADRKNGRTTRYATAGGERTIPSEHIACCREIGGELWFGAYNYLYRLRSDGDLEAHPLPYSERYRNNLLLDITADDRHPGTLWLGTERGLIHYDPVSRASRLWLENTPVKNFLHTGDSALWMGTDNGLYIKDDADRFRHFRHEVENSRSLPNNVVWAVFRDDGGNIWLGTDHGICIATAPADCVFHGIKNLTGSDDGLDVGVIRCDPAGNLWLGGMNGLIRSPRRGGAGAWYRSGAGGQRLAHNKVRDLRADGEGIWIASDGGLDRYDYATGRITHHPVTEASGRYSSSWMYAVREDCQGRLWMGTYDGGLFVVEKQRLSGNGVSVIADRHFSSESQPALSGNVVSQLALNERFCAVLTNAGLDIVDLDMQSSSALPIPGGAVARVLAEDGPTIWVGTDKGVCRVDADKRLHAIAGFSLPVQALIPQGDKLWVVSDSGISAYDISRGEWSHYPPAEGPVLCGTADDGNLYLGTIDGYFEFRENNAGAAVDSARVAITSLLLNNRPVAVGEKYGSEVILPQNITRTKDIALRHHQNSFALEFSSLRFVSPGGRFAYRLRGFDDQWQQTADNANRAVFINVPAGTYLFEVCALEPDGSPSPHVTSLEVRIRPVWYATTAAFLLYGMLLAGLALWIVYFIRMRHQLQIEHMEREKTLKMVAMKSEFFANLSHEFKSPLSIIIGLVSRMVASESNALRTHELRSVQSNAEKMHLLIDQMLDYNENGGTSLFIPAATSLQELSRTVFDRLAPAFAQKGVNARFTADDIGYIFMVDRIKMESVLENLLSNALKFTPQGGSVLMSVSVGEQTSDMLYADIRVEDTGCGIRPEEQPFVFNQYYRAPSGQGDNPNGSGIGLYLAKKIVEMHKGELSVSSSEGKGSCFTVRLSTMKADSFILQSVPDEEYSLHNLSKVWQHDRKPILLLVEDNPDIRDLIVASLGEDYTFCVAAEGRKGLDLLASEKIDLVITDIAMPGMDGLEMSRAIRSSVRTAFLPIIVLTGRNDMQTQLQSFEYADAFIAKPFNLNYLNSRIIQLLIKHEQYLQKIKQQQMLTPQVEALQSPDEKFLEEIVDIVNRHISDPGFSAAALCEESRYGSKQVYRKIKQLTGMGVVEFIRDTRLQKAALYLSQRKLSVTEIMYMVGFTTASYFSKCFKARFGVSPSDYPGRFADDANP